MAYQRIEKSAWRIFGDRVSKLLNGRSVSSEVVGLDLGDQIETQGLSLLGMSYDPPDDTFHVFLERGPGHHVDHVIRSPTEVYVEVNDAGVSRVVFMDADGHKRFVQILDPLKLPAQSS